MMNGSRVLLVQSDPIVALTLAEAFDAVGAEVVTTFGLPETFHEIGKHDLDGAVVHLDLDGISALPAAALLHESETPLVVVSNHGTDALLLHHFPGAIALQPGFLPQVAITALSGMVQRRRRRPLVQQSTPRPAARYATWAAGRDNSRAGRHIPGGIGYGLANPHPYAIPKALARKGSGNL